jgi:hypothetical protein
MAVTTTVSLHLVTGLQAIDQKGFGRPLTLRLKSRYGDTDITMFFEDEGLTKKIADAINDAVSPAEPPAAACPHEEAAYVAADFAYDTAREDRMFHR